MDDFKTIDRPGYFGSKRDAIHAQYDDQYGADNWRLGWVVGDNVFERDVMNMLYEDSYFYFLSTQPRVLHELLIAASDVYDDAPSNVQCGFDYTHQETTRTHVQDVAIRRVVARLGETFKGSEPLQIRDSLGEHPLSMTLSPGQVPFHNKHWLIQPELEGWWLPGSVESFYQSNKVLQVRS